MSHKSLPSRRCRRADAPCPLHLVIWDLAIYNSQYNKFYGRALGFVVTPEEFSARASGLDEASGENDLARLLAALVTASREFIGVADLEGRALFVNEAGRKLVGLRDLEAVRSTRLIEYFATEDQPRVIGEVLPAVRNSGFWEVELTFRNFADGSACARSSIIFFRFWQFIW